MSLSIRPVKLVSLTDCPRPQNRRVQLALRKGNTARAAWYAAHHDKRGESFDAAARFEASLIQPQAHTIHVLGASPESGANPSLPDSMIQRHDTINRHIAEWVNAPTDEAMADAHRAMTLIPDTYTEKTGKTAPAPERIGLRLEPKRRKRSRVDVDNPAPVCGLHAQAHPAEVTYDVTQRGRKTVRHCRKNIPRNPRNWRFQYRLQRHDAQKRARMVSSLAKGIRRTDEGACFPFPSFKRPTFREISLPMGSKLVLTGKRVKGGAREKRVALRHNRIFLPVSGFAGSDGASLFPVRNPSRLFRVLLRDKGFCEALTSHVIRCARAFGLAHREDFEECLNTYVASILDGEFIPVFLACARAARYCSESNRQRVFRSNVGADNSIKRMLTRYGYGKEALAAFRPSSVRVESDMRFETAPKRESTERDDFLSAIPAEFRLIAEFIMAGFTPGEIAKRVTEDAETGEIRVMRPDESEDTKPLTLRQVRYRIQLMRDVPALRSILPDADGKASLRTAGQVADELSASDAI